MGDCMYWMPRLRPRKTDQSHTHTHDTTGFPEACEPITARRQRDPIVRPTGSNPEGYMLPIQEEVGDLEAKEEEGKDAVVSGDGEVSEEQGEWRQVQRQVDDLNVRVARHFEDSNDNRGWQPPMVATPLQPTRDEWLRHQLTHTPYAAWCRRCNPARAVRCSRQSMER